MGFKTEICCDDNKSTFNPFNIGLDASNINQDQKRLNEISLHFERSLRDSKEVKKFFEKFPFLPYSGQNKLSSHKLVQTLEDMGEMSVTKGSIMNSVNVYSFGNKLKLYKGSDSEFDLGNDDLELQGIERETYYDFLKNILLYGEGFKSLVKKKSDSFQTTGEIFIEIVLYEENGFRNFGLKHLPSSKACYKLQYGEAKIIGISENWNYQHCKKNPPIEIPVYPFINEMDDGTFRTLLHYKNGCGPRGRPIDIASLTDQINEYKLKRFIGKQIDGNFMPQVLIELEGRIAKNPFKVGSLKNNNKKVNHTQQILKKIENEWTMKGNNPKSVIALNREKGAEHAFIHEFKTKTSEKFYKEVLAEAKGSIIDNNMWSEALIRLANTSGFNGDMYKHIFTALSCTKILDHQNIVGGCLNDAIRIGAEWMGEEQFWDNEIKFVSPIEKFLNVTEEDNENVD